MLTCMYVLRNPTIEDQALARIHRIGQRKEVTTVRFIVRDSFEEVRIKVNSYPECILQIIHLYPLTLIYI